MLMLLILGLALLASSVILMMLERKVFALIPAVVVGLALLFNSFTVVQPGTVAFTVLFGNISGQTLEAGFRMKNPFADLVTWSIQRRILEFQDGGDSADGADGVLSVSANEVPMSIDVTFAYRVNVTYAPWLYENIGRQSIVEDNLLRQAARDAVRAATAQFQSAEAMTSRRMEYIQELGLAFERNVVSSLVAQGMSEAEAARTFTFLPVQLRRMLPPDRVLDAITEQEAALRDLDRQQTLTQIASVEAERRSQEGIGVANLFAQLPEGFTANEIRLVLLALAEKQRSDAMLRAVEGGNVEMIIVPSSNSPIAIQQDDN